jgi:iron complex transport system ATP-binding protein
MNTSIENNKVLLKTDKLSLGYRQRKGQIVFLQQNLNLELFEGELVCLIGPNGCGKSTLIRTLSGIQQPIKGSVLVGDKDITWLNISERSDLMGVVLTDKDAVENISVREIAALGRYRSTNWLGKVSEEDEDRVSNALELVGLSGFEDRAYGSLSDGEKQRSFIAKVLASDSAIMLLDEPTAHLDIPNKVSIMSLLRDLTRKSGHALLVSTHELDLAMQLADQIWLMIPGDRLHTGTPEEILQSGLLDKVFGNDLLSFNPGSGSFCVKTDNKQTIFIEGNNSLFDITLKASKRLGYASTDRDNANIVVKIEESHWKISHHTNLYQVNTFVNLCRLLENLGKLETGNEHHQK